MLNFQEEYLPSDEVEYAGYTCTLLPLLAFALEKAFENTEDPRRLYEEYQKKAEHYASQGTTFVVGVESKPWEPKTDEARLRFANGVEKAKQQFLLLLAELN